MAVSGVSTSGLNFTGLATGIDTQKVIDGLNKINQQRIDRLNSQKTALTTKQTAFVTLQAQLFDLQSKTNALARSAGSAFDGRTATSSDSTAATAVAGTAAVPGTYTVNVVKLARGAQVASAGFADPNTALKTGTLKITVGSGTTTTVTVGSQNNTLQGVADSINAAGGDVRATVVTDSGTSEAKLLVTSSKTGAANAISVDASGLTGGSGQDLFTGGVPTVLQAAQDAQVTVGGGALSVSSPTNQINNVIAGVSLNLLKEGQTVTVSVAADTSGAVKAVQDFVTSYNAVKDLIASQTQYNSETQTAGTLLGNRDVTALSDALASALTDAVPGLTGSTNRLSVAGLSFNDSGKLVFDSSKLTSALNDPSGTAAAGFKKLFGLSGSTSNADITFLAGGTKTQSTAGKSVQVNVTAAATQAVVVASATPGSVALIPANPTLQFKLNSLLSSSVSLPAGPYNSTGELLAAVQKAINSAQSSSDNYVTVGLDGGGKVQISTQKYGSGANIAITGGSAEVLAALGFNGAESSVGTNVAGNFVVNGTTETAIGSGQILTGASGNATTAGLQLTSKLTAPGTGTVTVTQGVASRLSQVLNSYLDPVAGRFKAITDTYNQQTANIDKTIVKQQAVLDDKTAQLQKQFAAMETAVNNLKGLQTQLASLATSTNSNN
ncbi:Flagellar hook-associated protein 2 [Gemmata obscuriglobus]|uniref:Flagellar hook-associated protein 2 n=1 Tax=Gemmata obscuriglobus TaxID=114 RepID=A0A2Z3H1C3_9BACT|nr:flagellar filament capping protein FliD [Gemmata obscuriglobus]AWM37366.1 hypothetical protein C1280_10335 [Gemmata obscuriglobus]QEG29874.1 Flagellar hook-associated protein 2 [Gemmata obscuriglobus]VTS09192.1 flagellar capping protein : Flagellar hook-associated 2 domain protein OS=Methylovorus glucosetrophus (strain SIP3-4) GN=Msip34_0750 PE=4 SV=1: FliD_N: FliD_C [Gemmata obscuriglobus UQM 2246]